MLPVGRSGDGHPQPERQHAAARRGGDRAGQDGGVPAGGGGKGPPVQRAGADGGGFGQGVQKEEVRLPFPHCLKDRHDVLPTIFQSPGNSGKCIGFRMMRTKQIMGY